MRDPRWMLILLTLTQHQRLHWMHVGTEQLQLSQVNLDVKHITMLDDKLGQHFNLSGKHIPHCQHGQKTTSVQYVYATVCLGMHNSTSKWASRKTKKSGVNSNCTKRHVFYQYSPTGYRQWGIYYTTILLKFV